MQQVSPSQLCMQQINSSVRAPLLGYLWSLESLFLYLQVCQGLFFPRSCMICPKVGDRPRRTLRLTKTIIQILDLNGTGVTHSFVALPLINSCNNSQPSTALGCVNSEAVMGFYNRLHNLPKRGWVLFQVSPYLTTKECL